MEHTKEVLKNGDIIFKNKKDLLHREDGPAIAYVNGTKEWWLNGKRHRTDGPAIENINGNKEWYLNGKLHREDGPAIEYNDGDKEWYLNDKAISENEFLNFLKNKTKKEIQFE